jgi:hypothetical protein
MAPIDLMQIHMDPDHPVPGLGHHLQLTELPDEAVAELLRVAGPGSGSSLFSIEFRHLGGALSRRPERAGVQATVEGAYCMVAVGSALDEDTARTVDADLDTVVAALKPWSTGRSYLNFVERPSDPAGSFSSADYARLTEIKRRWDPDQMIHANHQIQPA